jgi:hypothetical protein
VSSDVGCAGFADGGRERERERERERHDVPLLCERLQPPSS